MDNPAPVQTTNEATGIIKLTHSHNPRQGEKLQPRYRLPKTQKCFSLVLLLSLIS